MSIGRGVGDGGATAARTASDSSSAASADVPRRRAAASGSADSSWAGASAGSAAGVASRAAARRASRSAWARRPGVAGLGLLGDELRLLLGRADDRRGARVTLGGDVAALLDGVGDDPGEQRVGADGVVVARDRVLHELGVDVGVDDGHDRDAELVGLGDRDVLLLRVEHEDGVGALAVMPRMPPRLRCSFSSSRVEQQRFLLRHRVELAGVAASARTRASWRRAWRSCRSWSASRPASAR